jgi:hypothetical protein
MCRFTGPNGSHSGTKALVGCPARAKAAQLAITARISRSEPGPTQVLAAGSVPKMKGTSLVCGERMRPFSTGVSHSK